MKTKRFYIFPLLAILAMVVVGQAEEKSKKEPKKEELQMSMADKFEVGDTKDWKVKFGPYLPLRFANVMVRPKKDTSFMARLNFLCDTPDLAKVDTPKKMEGFVRMLGKRALSQSAEKKLTLKKISEKGQYGFYTMLTDAKFVDTKPSEMPEGEHKYVVFGMVRLSKDSALMFTITTNDMDSKESKALMKYILGFVKKGAKEGEKTEVL